MPLILDKYLRAGPENFDRMIFEVFDLNGDNLIDAKDFSQVLLTLPTQAIISGLNAEARPQIVEPQEESKTTKEELHRYQYRIIKAPQGVSYLFRNKKLLMRIEE